MAFTLGEVSRMVQGKCVGDPSTILEGAAIIRDVQSGEITLADKKALEPELAKSPAAAVVIPEGFDPGDKPAIVVPNVARAFEQIVLLFHPRIGEDHAGISPNASVHPTAQIGPQVTIFPGVYVGPQVTIEAGVTLHPGVVVQAGCRIGADSTLFPNVVLYDRTEVGARCLIHANAVLGAYGFGYDSQDGVHRLSAQAGFVRIEDDVEIGAGSTIDRGTYGPTVIGHGSKLDNQVMVAHNCRIGRHNLLCSQVGIAGSCTTGDYVVMAGQVGIGDHVDIGSKTILGAKAGVMGDVPGDSIYVGIPATPHREQMQKQAAWAKLPEMRKEFKALQKELAALKEQVARSHSAEAA